MCGTSASSAKMPPSPLLFARMMKARYFTVTTMVSDQKNSDSSPITLSVDTTSECNLVMPALSFEKHSATA